MQKNAKKVEWTSEEINLLSELYPRFTSKRWKMISKTFRDHGFIRSELECREKWINFVDPTINNQEWDTKELEQLYQMHEKHGTRWCMVQKQIGRTQNRIKNRFYGTLRNYIRFVLNVLSQKQTFYNSEISKLSPSFLNSMFKGVQQFQFMDGQVKKMIFEMNYRINKKVLADRIRKQKELYEEFQKIILKSFSKQIKNEEIDQSEAEIEQKNQLNDEIKSEENEVIPVQNPERQTAGKQLQNQQYLKTYSSMEQHNMLMNFMYHNYLQENRFYYPCFYY